MSMMDEVVCAYVCGCVCAYGCAHACISSVYVCGSLQCGVSPWVSVTVQWSVLEKRGQDPIDRIHTDTHEPKEKLLDMTTSSWEES